METIQTMKNLSIEDSKSLIYLYIHVGFSSITEQDIGLNIHFNTASGNQWVITQSYAILRQLDSVLSKSSKKLGYIPFPILDKYLLRNIYKMSIDMDSGRATSNFILFETYRSAFQRWIHGIFQRQHLLPFHQREFLREMFHLPNGFAYNSEHLETIEKSATSEKKYDDGDTQTIKSFISSTSKSMKEPKSAKKRASILDRLKVTFKMSPHSSAEEKSFTNDDKQKTPYRHVVQTKKSNKLTMMVEEESRYEDELMSQQPLVKVSVHRKLEGKKDRIEYEVVLSSEPLPDIGISLPLPLREPYIIYRRYNEFKVLNKLLEDNNVVCAEKYAKEYQHYTMIIPSDDSDGSCISTKAGGVFLPRENVVILLSKFPLPPSKCSLGMPLTETDLSFRARRLDQWFREVIVAYCNMNNTARDIIRRFLSFDMSRELDISLQDRLVLGLVEASRAEVAVAALVLRHNREISLDESPISDRNGNGTGAGTGANRLPLTSTALHDLETMSQYSKNSHRSIGSNVTLTFKIKDEEMLAMQNYLLFSSKTTDEEIPHMIIYYVINSTYSSKSPYLDPSKRSVREYSDVIDDGTNHMWKSIALRLSVRTFKSNNLFIHEVMNMGKKKPTVAKRLSIQMGGLIRSFSNGDSPNPSSNDLTSTNTNTHTSQSDRSYSPITSKIKNHKFGSDQSSQEKTENASDDNVSVIVNRSKDPKNFLRIGMSDNDGQSHGRMKSFDEQDPIEIGMETKSKRSSIMKRGSIFGRK